jgi:hypothetical protein
VTHEGRARVVGAGPFEGDAGSDARARRQQAGSFEELDSALGLLPRYLRLAVLRDAGEAVGSSPAHFVDAAYAVLSDLLPSDLRVPRWAEDAVTREDARAHGRGRWANRARQQRRDEELRARRQAGASIAELEHEYGLRRSSVYAILQAAPSPETEEAA